MDEPISGEVWRRHPDMPDIEVSDQGRVRADAYTDARGNRRAAHHCLASPRTDGYKAVRLGRGRAQRKVHQLVLEAFVGPRPEGMEVLHLDANRSNNRLSNLRYGTRAENARQRVADGNHYATQRSHCPQGHPLVAPNLLPSARGYRRCKACKQAWTWKYDTGSDEPIQTVSDRYFARLGMPAA